MPLKKEGAQVDDAPLAVLYHRYASSLFTYLRTHLPTIEEAEDILLEVFTVALATPRLLMLPEKEQIAWIWSVTKKKISDYYRQSGRYTHVELGQVNILILDDTAIDPEKAAILSETSQRLRMTLQQLPVEQQELLRLRFFDGLRFSEIANKIGKREGNVRVMVSRILNVLRDMYQETWEE